MSPKFLDESRKYFETEMAFWQAKGTELAKTQLAAAEELVKESRTRLQAAYDAQSTLAVTLMKHGFDAAERGTKLFTEAFQVAG